MDGSVNLDMCLAASREFGAGSACWGVLCALLTRAIACVLSLAVAAAEGRVLALSFLLGISADPNTLDRWQGSPMDDALQGGTLYHMYCAKLLQAWGGELSRYHGSEEGAKFMEEIEKISIKSVRLLISKLIGQGLDRSKPHRLGDQAALVVMGACVRHMDIIVRMKERVASIAAEMSVLTQSIDKCSAEVQAHVESMLQLLETQARLSCMPEKFDFEFKDSRKRPQTAKRSWTRKTSVHDNVTALDLNFGEKVSRQNSPNRRFQHQEAATKLDYKDRRPPNPKILRSQSDRLQAAKPGGQERQNTMMKSQSMEILRSATTSDLPLTRSRSVWHCGDYALI
jgi:hypothetical protein